MMDCTFELTAGGKARCTRCNRTVAARSGQDLSRLHAECRALEPEPAPLTLADLPCEFRGAQLRIVGGCCGTPGRPVYDCQKHSECSLQDFGLRIDDDPSGPVMQVCASCPDRKTKN